MSFFTHDQCLQRLRGQVTAGKPIIGGGAGTGISAKCAEAGADVLIPHMGLTTKGSIGAKSALTLDDAAKRVQAMHDAAKSVKEDILVLCHGGPISEPEDAQYVLDHTQGVVGFFGASSVERLPTEVAITGCVRRFKELTYRQSAGPIV